MRTTKTGSQLKKKFNLTLNLAMSKIEAVKMKAANKEAACQRQLHHKCCFNSYIIGLIRKGLVKENAVMCANYALFWLNISLKIWFSDCI